MLHYQSWTSQRWFRLTLCASAGMVLVLAVAHLELTNYRRCQAYEPASFTRDNNDDMTAGNKTLGFNGILALSQGTQWRVEGLRNAAHASGIEIHIPEQPIWSDPFVQAFQEFGPIEAHGAAMAWLGHIDLLKFIIQSGWGSAMIMEDDMDWSVDIRHQARLVAKAVLNMTGQEAGQAAPYGLEWDVLWMGHCSDPPDFSKPHVVFDDDTSAPLDRYVGLNHHITDLIGEAQRAVHVSVNPVCTWAYAVSASGARKVLQEASQGKGGAFDLMLMHACQSDRLECISVNPQLFDPYHPAEGDESEVGAGDRAQVFKSKSTGKGMGRTDNILRSARCLAQFGKPCFFDLPKPKPKEAELKDES